MNYNHHKYIFRYISLFISIRPFQGIKFNNQQGNPSGNDSLKEMKKSEKIEAQSVDGSENSETEQMCKNDSHDAG